MRRYAMMAGVGMILGGCATVPAPTVPVVDPALASLADSARQVHALLNTLASVEQARGPVVVPMTPPQDPGLQQWMDFQWDGGLQPALAAVARRIGYQFVVVGAAPAVPLLATIDVQKTPAFAVLRDLGQQAGRLATVVLDAGHREIQLIYASEVAYGR